MAESPYQPERTAPTPAEQFDAWLREADAREAAHLQHWPVRTAGWLRRMGLYFVGLCLWAVILLGLSRAVLGWP